MRRREWVRTRVTAEMTEAEVKRQEQDGQRKAVTKRGFILRRGLFNTWKTRLVLLNNQILTIYFKSKPDPQEAVGKDRDEGRRSSLLSSLASSLGDMGRDKSSAGRDAAVRERASTKLPSWIARDARNNLIVEKKINVSNATARIIPAYFGSPPFVVEISSPEEGTQLIGSTS